MVEEEAKKEEAKKEEAKPMNDKVKKKKYSAATVNKLKLRIRRLENEVEMTGEASKIWHERSVERGKAMSIMTELFQKPIAQDHLTDLFAELYDKRAQIRELCNIVARLIRKSEISEKGAEEFEEFVLNKR